MEARDKGNRDIVRVKLRAHHILCMLGFRGLGYSAGFVENFVRVKESAKGSVVELVDGGDAICAACPNFDGRCTKGEAEVRAMDAVVLALFEYQIGAKVDFEAAMLKAKVVPHETRLAICSGCEWLEHCGLDHGKDTHKH